jgi:hypothetical protein
MISVLKAIAQTVFGEQSLPQHVCLFYPKEGYKVGSVELDLILDEDHSKSAQVTENPLQDGRAISDGIFLELQEGSLTGLVTNHSVKIAEERAKQLELQDSETLMAEAENYQLENRAKQAWVDLKAVMDAKQPVTIVTSLEVYDNVAITNISTERNGDSGDALEIKVSFRQILTVSLMEHEVTAQVQPKDMDSDINRKSALGVNGGQKVASEPTVAEKKQLTPGIIEAE